MSMGLRLAAAGLIGVPLAGCIENNARSTIGGDLTLAMLAEPAFSGDARGTEGASLRGLDRSGWARSDFLVPVDGAEYRPLYAEQPRAQGVTARDRGQPPSPRSALELSGIDGWDAYGEALESPALAMWDLIRIPYFMYREPAWRAEQRGTTGTYWRGTLTDPRRADWAGYAEPEPRTREPIPPATDQDMHWYDPETTKPPPPKAKPMRKP